MSRIPVFAGLGSESLFSDNISKQATRDSGSSAEAQSLVSSCHRIFLEEVIPKINKGELVEIDVDDYQTPNDLLNPPLGDHDNAAVQHPFLCLIQLLRYLALKDSFTTRLLGASGFCAGLLPAAAAAASRSKLEFLSHAQDCFRVAVKIGIASEQYRRETSTVDNGLPWSLIVDGITADDTQELLSTEVAQKTPSAIFVSSRNSEKSVTLSAEGQTLRQFVNTKLPHNCRVRPTNVFSLYHNRAALSDVSNGVLEDVKKGGFRFPSTEHLVGPIFNTIDGSRIDNDGSGAGGDLLESILQLIFLEPADWMTVQESVLAFAKSSVAAASFVQIQNFGPGYGALIYRKDLPRTIRVKDVSTAVEEKEEWSKSDIAIVGAALDVPGAEMDTNKLWQNIMNGINTCSKIPGDRFHIEDYHTERKKPELGNPNRSMDTQYGSFLENPFLFDNTFFGISPREARSMDPQQRLLLQTAQRALEDSGYSANDTGSFAAKSFGCYIGAATGDYADNLKEEMDVYWVPGVLRSFLSGRISYAYGWGGPSLTVDTACSSSIVGIWQAARALQAGDCNACVAGGVNVVTSPDMYIGLDRAHFLSPTGQCKSFDDPVDGYCRADGCAIVVLKRMSDALAENDRILGVIKGIEVNQSGTAHSITHPHTPTQELLFKSVWQKNGIDPLQVSVVEAHGTGTDAGDPSEMHGITNSLCEKRTPQNPLYIGSLKANIGHSEAASGAASLIKLLLMFKNKTLPPQTLFNRTNSNIHGIAKRGAVINREARAWETHGGAPRLAMLNNFGGSGSNGALIVQEYVEDRPSADTDGMTYYFGCSTKSNDTLLKLRDQIIAFLEGGGRDLSLRDVCYTSTARRQLYSHRLSTTASSISELISNLREASVVGGDTREKAGRAPEAVRLRPCSYFQVKEARCVLKKYHPLTGVADCLPQYLGMGRELKKIFPSVGKTINRCHRLLTKWCLPTWLDVIDANLQSQNADHDNFEAFQVSVFVLEVAIAELLMSFGIIPKAVAGHSLGEYAALVIAGVMDLPTGLRLAAYRASLIAKDCKIGETGMLAVASSAANTSKLLSENRKFEGPDIACINSPDDCVVGGPLPMLEELKRTLLEKKITSKILAIPIAYHTTALEPIAKPLNEFAQQIHLSPPAIPIASNQLERVIEAGENAITTEYFAKHSRETVKFDGAMETLISKHPTVTEGCWIEVGPHPIVLPMVRSRLSGTSSQLLSTMKKGIDPSASIAQLLSQLYLAVDGLDWRKTFENQLSRPSLVSVPGVPFVREEFYVEYPRDYAKKDGVSGLKKYEHEPESTQFHFLSHVIEGPTSNESGNAVFETPVPALAAYITGHTVFGHAVCPTYVYIELAYAAVSCLNLPDSTSSVTNVKIPKSLVFPGSDATLEQSTIVVRVAIQLRDPIQGLREFVISSYDRLEGLQYSQVHCRGIVKSRSHLEVDDKYSNLSQLLGQRKFNMENTDGNHIQTFSISVLYDKVFSHVVSYSKVYQSIQHIKINTAAKEAVATCRVPASRQSEKFVMDPALTDAFFHVPGFVANLFITKDEICVLNYAKSVILLRDVASDADTFEVHCELYEIEDGHVVIADAQATDSRGVFAVVKSIRFQRIQKSEGSPAFCKLIERSQGHFKTMDQEGGKESSPGKAETLTEPLVALKSHKSSSSLSSEKASTAPSTPPETPSSDSEKQRSTGNEDLTQSIENIIADTCRVPRSKIMPTTVLEQLGIDSLMLHELLDELSELSAKSVTMSQLTECDVVGDIVPLLQS